MSSNKKVAKEIQYSGTDLADNNTVGFVRIIDLGDAQQVTVDTTRLARTISFLQSMQKMGFDHVTITVQKNKPLIIGGKQIGVGIAPAIDVEE
jgi:hypothetical protein